ncbi:hypothetical protein [Pseudomonas sp. LB3P38]|uniref:hypothetical protein n=1 Tax=Pseudomonas lyxosi TaxID=3398358 RepID=UPI0039F041D3
MNNLKNSLILGVFCIIASNQALAEKDCVPNSQAPGTKFENPKPWGKTKTDSGAVVYGFVDLVINNINTEVVHGVDLSEYNNVRYDELRRCGATFAFVKMRANSIGGYQKHYQKLLAQTVVVVPYYFLDVPGAYQKNPKIFNKDNVSAYADLLEKGREIGRLQAAQFVKDLQTAHPENFPATNIAGLSGQMIALDVEDVFADTLKPTSLQRQAYGGFYGAMVGSWIVEVRKTYPQLITFFYTFPAIFQDYLLYAEREDNKIIHGMPIWLANTRADASDIDFSKKTIGRVCFSASGGNRCIVHQYTHRGVFASADKQSKGEPNHIDLNRFFNSTTIVDGVGVQYIRTNSIKPDDK